MYSQKSFRITKDEFNYLLPVLKNKLLERGDMYYFISYDINELTDMLNRLKGLYNNYDEVKNMTVYYCSKEGSLKPFRDSIGVTEPFNKNNIYAGGGNITMTKLEKKIQKKVDEINNLISLASNSESDNAYDGNLMVTDTSSTWEEPAIYKPIVFRNGVLYIEYFEPYSNRTKKDKILKRDLEFDGYGTLLDIAKIYRRALKKENIKYAGGGKIKPFEYKENNSTIMFNGTKADVKKMYLDYKNNFLSVRKFAEYYNISETQANSIINEGRKYAKEDGYYADGGVTEKYVSRQNLNTITIKKGNQKLTYKISDVLNGAYKLESGANLEDIAFYVPKRSIVKVQLKTGNDFKPANGYWIEDSAKPIHVTKFDEGGVMSRLLTRKKDQPKVETTDEDIDLNEDSRIRVRPSSFVSKDKEGDWMMKKNSSKEARSYAGGGNVQMDGKLMYEKVKFTNGVEDYYYSSDLHKINFYCKEHGLNPKNQKDFEKAFSELKKQNKISYKGGGKVTFSEKAKAIAKNFKGKRVEPKYQKEYGKVYDTKEAKEVGNKIAGSQKAKYDAKAEKGAVVSKGKGNHKMKATTDLARKIRKDGEKWTDAIKRASQQLK